ncbi:MAG: C40 family peptidase [Gammaproteobacteria bacterium]|nr:C40 family peptidase [Gammaproteobacteria bacterium]
MMIKVLTKSIPAIFAIAIAACGSLPERSDREVLDDNPVADRVVFSAIQFIGVPYKFGGTSLNGVDCSGLVYLAYQNAGMHVPRTSKEQYSKSQKVRTNSLRPGDLLFFKLQSRNVSHVGIFLGDGRFIHAPRTGKNVSYAHINNPFWSKRLVSAGRFY